MNRVAVVTGAAGGLGSAIVAALLADASTPVLLDVDRDGLAAAAEEIERESGRRPSTIVCDVTEPASVEAAAAQVQREHGRCDILVNNAAILVRSPLEEHAVDLWDRILKVNLRGYFVSTQTFGRLMLAGDGGAIVNIASLAAEAPSYSNGAYCASKAGVLALTRSTALEWGPRGVRANAVSPAYMRTPMTTYMAGDEAHARTSNNPLGRVGDTSEIARVVVFLASAESSYLNGINVPVDGGLSQARAGGWSGPAQ